MPEFVREDRREEERGDDGHCDERPVAELRFLPGKTPSAKRPHGERELRPNRSSCGAAGIATIVALLALRGADQVAIRETGLSLRQHTPPVQRSEHQSDRTEADHEVGGQ